MCSPGCFNCYALARNKRFSGGANWGKGAPRRHTSDDNWKKPEEWNRRAGMVNRVYAEAGDTAPPIRPRVFCASLADWLDDEVPIEWLADLLDLIRRTPNLDWLLLTKRPQNWEERLDAANEFWFGNAPLAQSHYDTQTWASAWNHCKQPPDNVWIGVTVEDQIRADERIPLLLNIPAKVRFLSCEPLLTPVDLKLGYGVADQPLGFTRRHFLHWVIAGCESGPAKRPMAEEWAQSLALQCQTGRVAFFMKQIVSGGRVSETLVDFPADLQVRQFPETCQRLSNI